MFRTIRRVNLALPEDVCLDILNTGSYGTFAFLGDDDYPYAVPVNYAFDGKSIYVHCALEGHKMDAIARHDKASFSIVDAHEVIPDELTCDYRSVLVFGRVDVVKDEAEKINALYLLCKKYASNTQTDVDAYISKQAPATAVFKMTVEHMSGKEGRRLALARKDQN